MSFSRPRSSCGWVPTTIITLRSKSTRFQLSNALSIICLRCLETDISSKATRSPNPYEIPQFSDPNMMVSKLIHSGCVWWSKNEVDALNVRKKKCANFIRLKCKVGRQRDIFSYCQQIPWRASKISNEMILITTIAL